MQAISLLDFGNAVSGGMGQGKSIFCVYMIKEALNNNLKVATNMDIFLDELMPSWNKSHIYRLSDQPTTNEIRAIGRGSNSKDESTFGLLILDEAGSFLNSRDWQNGDRSGFNHLSRMSRKLGWKLILITQHKDLLDKQIRLATITKFISLRRLDKFAIPFFGFIFGIFGIKLKLPRVHAAVARIGSDQHAPLGGSKLFFAKSLYKAYDTEQIYESKNLQTDIDDGLIDSCDSKPLWHLYGGTSPGLHSVLSSWHRKGRHLSFWNMYKKVIISAVFAGFIIGLVSMWQYYYWKSKQVPVVVPVISANSPIIRGYIFSGDDVVADVLEGNSQRWVRSSTFKLRGTDLCVKEGEKWIGKNC